MTHPSCSAGTRTGWFTTSAATDLPIPSRAVACRRTGEARRLEEDWWVRKDGSMIPVACTAVPITTPDGYGDAVAITDLTARMAAEQAAREREVAEARAAELTASEARLRAILEASHDGVLSI